MPGSHGSESWSETGYLWINERNGHYRVKVGSQKDDYLGTFPSLREAFEVLAASDRKKVRKPDPDREIRIFKIVYVRVPVQR